MTGEGDGANGAHTSGEYTICTVQKNNICFADFDGSPSLFKFISLFYCHFVLKIDVSLQAATIFLFFCFLKRVNAFFFRSNQKDFISMFFIK